MTAEDLSRFDQGGVLVGECFRCGTPVALPDFGLGVDEDALRCDACSPRRAAVTGPPGAGAVLGLVVGAGLWLLAFAGVAFARALR